MKDINSVVLLGNLTRDADVRYSSSGCAIAKFCIAVNRSKKQGDQWIDEANFFDCTLFGKQAESLKPYLVKGKRVAVHGELKQDRWEKDGVKNSKVGIECTDINLISGSGKGDNAADNNNQPSHQQIQNTKNYVNNVSNGNSTGFPEDIPF